METLAQKMNTVWKELQAAVGEGWCVNTEMTELAVIWVQYQSKM